MLVIKQSLLSGVYCLSVCCYLLLLAACDYAPAGIAASTQQRWPEQLQRLSLTGLQRYDPLYQSLRAELRAYGIRLVPLSAATAHLSIVDKQEAARTISYDQQAKSREQLLSLRIDFLVSSPAGQVMLARQTVAAEAVYLYNADRYLASHNEKKMVMQELHRHLSRQLLRRLAVAAKQLQETPD